MGVHVIPIPIRVVSYSLPFPFPIPQIMAILIDTSFMSVANMNARCALYMGSVKKLESLTTPGATFPTF